MSNTMTDDQFSKFELGHTFDVAMKRNYHTMPRQVVVTILSRIDSRPSVFTAEFEEYSYGFTIVGCYTSLGLAYRALMNRDYSSFDLVINQRILDSEDVVKLLTVS